MAVGHAIPFDRALRFLRDDALPLWAERGAYDNGCFVEHLDLDARPVDPGFTRTRAQARQLYVYSHAKVAGLWADDQLAANAEAFFIQSCWLGPDHGWARRISRFGDVIDPTNDLYDISFALFALAWRQRVAPDPKRLELAHQTLDLIERVLKAPHGGYWNDSDKTLPREQNPHMHLAEAANAWFEASADTRFSDLASELVDLMQRRFSDPVSGQLGEFFGLDWSPIGGDSGSIVEPGHQFEWSWIISHFGRLTGRPSLEIAERLIKSGQAGFDPATGLTVDQVDRKGRILQASRRLWPQTEALKAALVEAEFFGKANNERIAKITNALFANYLDTAPVGGTWIDHYNQDGSIKADKIPSTSLYHIQLAFLELLRLEPKLSNS